MNIAKSIVQRFGGPSALAKAVGKRQSTISYWERTGVIPAKWQPILLDLAGKQGVELSAEDFFAKTPSIVHTNDNVDDDNVDDDDDVLPPSVATHSGAGGKLPESPYAQWRGVIDLGGDPVDCYVLDTGQRVISLRAAVRSIADADSGDLAKFIGVSSMKSFIDKDLVLAELFEFSIPGTQFKGSGLSTANFEMILRAYVRALYEKAELTDRQHDIAVKCAVITSGLVRTGLDALVDEATGYQYERAEDALQVKLRAFIADELRAWEKTFPDELWQEFGRLTNWSGPLHSRPRWWGKLVLEMIYDTLDKDVATYLKDNKPEKGVHWHRQLTENIGVRQLVSRCFEVVGMAKTCSDIRELRERVAQHYGRKTVQLTLSLPRNNPER